MPFVFMILECIVAIFKFVDQNSTKFSLFFLLVISLSLNCMLYLSIHSFRVHQKTLQRMHAHNCAQSSRFLYKMHVGPDGTTLEPILLDKCKEATTTLTIDQGSEVVTAIVPDVQSPLEQFVIHPWIIDSLFMLLTSSLVLLLVYFVKKNTPNKNESLIGDRKKKKKQKEQKKEPEKHSKESINRCESGQH